MNRMKSPMESQRKVDIKNPRVIRILKIIIPGMLTKIQGLTNGSGNGQDGARGTTKPKVMRRLKTMASVTRRETDGLPHGRNWSWGKDDSEEGRGRPKDDSSGDAGGVDRRHGGGQPGRHDRPRWPRWPRRNENPRGDEEA